MVDELLCLETVEGAKKFSVAKLAARITYFAVGSGLGIGGRYIYNRVKK